MAMTFFFKDTLGLNIA
jgi:hypothetical protein